MLFSNRIPLVLPKTMGSACRRIQHNAVIAHDDVLGVAQQNARRRAAGNLVSGYQQVAMQPLGTAGKKSGPDGGMCAGQPAAVADAVAGAT